MTVPLRFAKIQSINTIKIDMESPSYTKIPWFYRKHIIDDVTLTVLQFVFYEFTSNKSRPVGEEGVSKRNIVEPYK